MSNKSNSKVVKEIIRKEILDSLEGNFEVENHRELLQGFYNQIKFSSKGVLKKIISINDVICYLIDGCYASFKFEESDIKNFIDNLDLNNNSNKKFSNVEYFNMYKYLICRETLYLFKKYNIEYELIFYR